jgi:hypothetical protein
MRRRDYVTLLADIRRLRPVIVIVLATVVILPSMYEMVTQALSPLTVLFRLAQGLAVIGILVWIVSAVVVHYARIQVKSQRGGGDLDGGTHT